MISIHAPRTGSDGHPRPQRQTVRHFNPRSPHGERRSDSSGAVYSDCISIHAPRTGSDPTDYSIGNSGGWDFNPRSPHGERPSRMSKLRRLGSISIHAPRTGSDAAWRILQLRRLTFQSTLPARGATFERGDTARQQSDFNPRSPHGERPFLLLLHFTL